jgi:hypothetical protein
MPRLQIAIAADYSEDVEPRRVRQRPNVEPQSRSAISWKPK